MSDQPMDLNLEELKELIRLLKESNVSEFELRKADYRLRIKQGFIEEASVLQTKSLVQPNGQGAGAMETTAAETADEKKAAEAEELHEIQSPIVGTFYRSASPGSSAFVEVGDLVRKNQVLCIVEAMKIMNEIESDVDGEVRAIHAANGQPVEFGEPLFSIKPVA